MQKIPVLVLLLLSGLSVVTGDYFAKYWSINQKTIFYILAILGYLGSSIFYIPTLLREGLIITSIIWSLISTIGLLFVGLVVFKEVLTVWQIIGVSLGIMALVILSV